MNTRKKDNVQDSTDVTAAKKDDSPENAALGSGLEWPKDSDAIRAMLAAASERKDEPGRFDTGGRFGVFNSGLSASWDDPDVRRSWLGKDRKSEIYSQELAAKHVEEDKRTININETPGGRELDTIAAWIKSDVVGPDERDELKTAWDELVRHGSGKFAESAKENLCSVGYVEHSPDESVYKDVEESILDGAPGHWHITDKPPTPKDKIH